MSKKDKNDFIKETVENRLYTYGDYLKWTDESRYELIDGRFFLMSPVPSRFHQKVSGELFRQFANYLFDKDCEVYEAPFDLRLPERDEKDEDIKTVVQPDILLICDKMKLDKKGCKGAPDLIIEIVSPSTGARDRKDKRNLYEEHGVKEYWLVDYNEKTVEIYLLNKNNKYGKPDVYLEDDRVPVNIINGLEINLSYVFKDL